jgi:membrane protease YdiL (CAAX protease family)
MTETLTRRMTAAVPLALVAVVGWLVLEVVCRLAFGVAGVFLLEPTVGDSTLALVAGSYFALLFGFPVAAVLLSRYAHWSGQTRDDWDYQWDVRTIAIGIGAGVLGVGASFVVSQADAALFGSNEAARSVLVDTLTAAPWLAAVLLVGNGVVAPAAEERVWRGIAQTDLVARWGVVAGIAVTAVLFSLKHVVVDASLGRLFTLIALGLVWGAVRHRWGTSASTAAHVTTNVIATTRVVLLALG